jgi:hypothetical protein
MERRTSGGSLNTFVMGILVGVALTLLLTTKKGRKLLKILIEEGSDRISKWEDMLQKAQEEVLEEDDDEEIVEAEEYVEPMEREAVAPEPVREPEPAPAPQKTFEKIEPVAPEEKKPVKKESTEKETAEKPEKEAKPKSRRFFRGVRKK